MASKRKLYAIIVAWENSFGRSEHPIDTVVARSEKEAWDKAEEWAKENVLGEDSWVLDVVQINPKDCVRNPGFGAKTVNGKFISRDMYEVDTFYGKLFFVDWECLVA